MNNLKYTQAQLAFIAELKLANKELKKHWMDSRVTISEHCHTIEYLNEDKISLNNRIDTLVKRLEASQKGLTEVLTMIEAITLGDKL